MLAIFLLIIGIFSRLVLHIPNFTPIMAIALFSGFYTKKKYAVFLPVVLMMVTDLILGLHEAIFFTWGSVALIAGLGLIGRKNKNVKTVAGFSLASAILFFVITNFGVWLVSGLYETTLSGLGRCFTLAIPFFRYTLLSTLIYTFVFFGLFESIAFYVRKTKLAHVLL